MAGHRRGYYQDGGSKPRRCDSRLAHFEHDVNSAPTADAQLAMAFDYFRAAARRHPDHAGLMHEMATELYVRTRRLIEAEAREKCARS